MNIEELKKFAEERNLSERTIKDFQYLLKNYQADDPEEFDEVFNGIDIQKLYYEVQTVSLNLGNWPECTYNNVSVSMGVYYNEKKIASYKVLYRFSGEEEDDFVEFF